jgi:hypothetical protein
VLERRGREVDVAHREMRDGLVPPRGLVGLPALEPCRTSPLTRSCAPWPRLHWRGQRRC